MKTTISIIAATLMLGSCTSRKQDQPAAQQPGTNTAKPATETQNETLGTAAKSAGENISGTREGDAKINSSRDTTGDAAASGGGKINSGRDTGDSAVGTAGSAGAHAAYKPAPSGYSMTNVTTWVTAAKATHAGMKFVYVPPENAADKDLANTLRVAAGKAWNHLSWKPEIDVPEDVSEGTGLVFALNAPKIWGADAEKNWGYIASCSPKGNIQVSPAPNDGCQNFGADEPVAISRFVFNATNGGPYANIHGTPSDYGSFSSTFSLGKDIKYVSTHKEAIVCGPRITAYRSVHLNGANVDTWYSFTSDEFDGRDNGNINYTNAPTDADQRQTGSFNAAPNDGNTAIASEWWMQLPNGFMYWGIHGEGGQERGKAEFPFAIDPANWKQGNELATGRSCITCHATGIHAAKSDEDKAGKNGWTSNEDLAKFYTVVRDKFQGGMKTLVTGLSDGTDEFNARLVAGTIEPISKAVMLVEGAYSGGNDCSFFCNGKYGPQRQNLCETLPTRK